MTNTNDVYCWGDRRGLGTNLPAADVLTPVRVLGGDQGGAFFTDVQQVSVGWNRVCALMLDTSVYCWGYNSFLGSGPPTETEGPTPRRVLGGAQGGTFLTDIVQFKQNFGNATCGISSTSELFCWGYIFGNLPSYLDSGEQSTTEPFFRNAQTIMMGPGSFCFIDNTNRTYCVGSNVSGALGFDPLVDGTNFNSLRFFEL